MVCVQRGSQGVGVATERKRQTVYVWGQSIFLVRRKKNKRQIRRRWVETEAPEDVRIYPPRRVVPGKHKKYSDKTGPASPIFFQILNV
jgi:hypothetical protein